MPLPRTSRLDAARIALLHSFSPSQQREIAEWVAGSRNDFPRTVESVRRAGFRFRDRKRQLLAQLPDGPETESLMIRWEEDGCRFLQAQDPGFPRELWEIPDPPLHLFVNGTLRLDEDRRPRVAVVGSRAASQSGLRLARELGRDLALADCVVVSGLARGIDGAAHRGAVSAGGGSIAVLGAGLDRIYPGEHAALASEIASDGLLVSEFAPGTPPLPLHFPRRNRILTGLADALVVVEGGERSGARSSVDHALDQGREVLAVPRDPLHDGSRLPNRLLRDGAIPLVSARDVLDLVSGAARLRSAPDEPDRHALGSALPTRADRGDADRSREGGPAEAPHGGDWSGESLARRLCGLLERRPGRSTEELSADLPSYRPAELLSALSNLELEGRLRRHPGGRWFPEGPVGSRV